MQSKYVLITEAALDAALTSSGFDSVSMMPLAGRGVHCLVLSDTTVGYRAFEEPSNTPIALVGTQWMLKLHAEGAGSSEIYRRVARVIKGMKSPPIHLPRQWSEYHFKNLITFFASPRDVSNLRWVVDIKSEMRCSRFDYLSSSDEEKDLQYFSPTEWPADINNSINILLNSDIKVIDSNSEKAIAEEFDLQTIGSSSIVEGRSYDEWSALLSDNQKALLENDFSASIRVVGPAGSGKTLSLCLRATKLSMDKQVQAQGKRILVATHSWAMAERIDGVLNTLSGGISPKGVTVFPLLSLLELHAGHIGHHKTNVIGNDSTDGRLKSLDIISDVITRIDLVKHPKLSRWINDALTSARDSRQRVDLTLDLYEELTGVLTASGVAPDDQESIQSYLESPREDWMPPFVSMADRGFVIAVFRLFMQELIDREAITTDQFILDSIRVLETYTWRMRKETEGYDFIFIDELQLFDPQERTALELLGRSRRGVPFTTAEDPAQGVFSALNSRREKTDNATVYLEVVHRFNAQIFEFISFVYRQFPLNALPLRIHESRGAGKKQPLLITATDEQQAILQTVDLTLQIHSASGPQDRLCVATLGDVDASIVSRLTLEGMRVVRLESFDDVERLSYSKKSIVVAPWQFIGGMQFANVIVIASGLNTPNSQFGRLREMVSVYLSCSRATESLHVICAGYVPKVLVDAVNAGLMVDGSAT